jgi:hypothetical protein
MVCHTEKWYRVRLLTERVLRKTFGCKRNEVIGDWRKYHIGRLRDLYYTTNIIQIKKSEIGVECSTYGGEERCMKRLVGNLRLRLLGNSRYV